MTEGTISLQTTPGMSLKHHLNQQYIFLPFYQRRLYIFWYKKCIHNVTSCEVQKEYHVMYFVLKMYNNLQLNLNMQ